MKPRKDLSLATWLFIISVFLLMLSEYLKKDPTWRGDYFDAYNRFQNVFLEKERDLDDNVKVLISYLEKEGALKQKSEGLLKIAESFHDNQQAFYLFQDDKMVFWSENEIVLEDKTFSQFKNQHTFTLKNGWYYGKTYLTDDYSILGVFKIKSDYKYENRFLINKFQPDFRSPQAMEISLHEGVFEVSNLDNRLVFFISYDYQSDNAFLKTRKLISNILALGFLLFAFLSIFITGRYYQKKDFIKGSVIFILLILVYRFILFYFKLPGVFYQGMFFNPVLYASSSFFPSLGDYLLHAFFWGFIIWFVFAKHIMSKPEKSNIREMRLFEKLILADKENLIFKQIWGNEKYKRMWQAIFIAPALALIVFLSHIVVDLLHGLIMNSSLVFDVNSIFRLNYYSLLGFLGMGLWMFSYHYLTRIIYLLIKKTSLELHFLLIFIVGVFILYGLFFSFVSWWLVLVLLVNQVYYAYLSYNLKSETSISRLVGVLLLISLLTTLVMHESNQEKEFEKRKSLALKLTSEQDPIAEFLFHEFEEELKSDSVIINFLKDDPYNEERIYRSLVSRYFRDYWQKYDVQVTVCLPGEYLIIKPANYEIDCDFFFRDYIRSVGKPTLSNSLFYLDNNTGRNSYISRISYNIGNGHEKKKIWLNIELDLKYVANDLGFPELLIGKEVKINRDLASYSYAVYREDKLVNKFGFYPYSINQRPYGEFTEEFTFFNYDGFHHLIFKKDSQTSILVSKRIPGFFETIAPFSYLFIFYFLLSFIFLMLSGKFSFKEIFTLSFKRRVQLNMIGIVLISLIFIGGGSIYYVYNIYENKNQAHINEKIYSVLIELEHKLAHYEFLDSRHQDYLHELLLKFSNVFFTDINMYDLNGNLLASSRPKVFDEGLVSRRMNPYAYNELVNKEKSLYIHNESIGKLKYLSAYTPFQNSRNQLMAYLNLPYFAKQNELQSEISAFLVAFVNIYLMLMVLAIALAFVISNYVTRPLQMIRSKLGKVRLGGKNEKLVWNRNDEIGHLVDEYNHMIDQLSESVELLSRSERETAWREMAKQVAHEIKNPLTPMKLSVQYLERAWKDKAPDWDERLTKFTKTIVEQIDSLSVIATAFSDFAKMPSGQREPIELNSFLTGLPDLYKGFKHVQIDIALDAGKEENYIFFDRQHLLRIFNNLLKNSIQAVEKGKEAHINIRVSRENEQYIISLRDNGKGIPDELKVRIFSPNFTTKTGGMGLGLAMVKNMLEMSGGKIWFESEFEKGTTFWMSMPVYHLEID